MANARRLFRNRIPIRFSNPRRMAKIKIIHLYFLCFLFCNYTAKQSALNSPRNQTDQQWTRACVKEIYDAEVGVREYGGSNRGLSVEMYLKSVNLEPSYAWCAAFVSWCYQYAGVDTPKSGWVPDYAMTCKRIYHRNRFEKRTPQQGDVFLIWYPKRNRPAHMGFIDKWGDKWITTVEGNTNDSGSREGNGVYKKRRLKKQVWVVSDFISTSNCP